MITELKIEMLDDLYEICRTCFPKEYNVTEDKLLDNLFLAKDFSPKASFAVFLEGNLAGFIGVKISDNQELYPATAWISILAVLPKYQNHGVATLLLESAEKVLKLEKVKMLYIGMDFKNFFSGIPVPNAEKERFFTNLGFKLNNDYHYDLEADIITNDKIDSFDTKVFEKDFSVDTYHGEAAPFLDFLKEEFPGRWVYEAEQAISGSKKREEIVLLWNRERSKVLGFCMLTANFGYGGLGPIGIAKTQRGKRVGEYLLRESLIQLRKLGVSRVNIDWTVLVKYYGKFDFLPARTYRAATKTL